MKSLDKYIKAPTKQTKTVTTSVTIDESHAEFIQRLNLNLSAMVRDLIDDLIKKSGKLPDRPD